MATEILLYNSIWSWTAEQFVLSLIEAKNDDVLVRVNTEGGDPSDMFAIVTRMSEHEGDLEVAVDGKAHSSGLFLLCYAKKRRANDVSTFVLHRASWGEWFENSSLMTDAHWEIMNNVNASLRKAVENTIDEAKFEKITGHTLDEVFDNKTRLDVSFNSSDAKKIGFIDEITTITPEITANMANAALKMAASFSSEIPTELKKEKKAPKAAIEKPKPIEKNMTTLDEFKAAHPALFAEAVSVGVKQEANRTKAFMAFFEIDAKVVKEKIESGIEFDVSFSAEMSAVSIGKLQASAAGEENGESIETEKPEGELEASQKTITDGVDAVKKQMGL